MAAALEVEAQLNAVGKVLPSPAPSERGKRRNADHAVKTNENYEQDENKLPLELGIHAGWLTLLRFGLKSRDGVARNLDFHLLGDAQLHGVIFKADDRAIDAAVGDHLVAILQILQHFGDFLLAALSGHDHQEIKNHHDQNQRKNRVMPPGCDALQKKAIVHRESCVTNVTVLCAFSAMKRAMPAGGSARLARNRIPFAKIPLRPARAQHRWVCLLEACLKVRAESFELSKTDSLANFAHHVKVKVEVVVGVQDGREEFSSGIKMPQIGTGVSPADGARAIFINRARIVCILRIPNQHAPLDVNRHPCRALRVGSTQSIMSTPSAT